MDFRLLNSHWRVDSSRSRMRIGLDYFFSFSCNEIYFFATCLLAGEHFIAILGQIGKYYILNQLVGVVLHGKTEMAIA